MGRDDWYRRTTWTPQDKAEFHARLARSRSDYNKVQYAYIQATCLRKTKRAELVRAADELLDYVLLEVPDQFLLSQVYLEKAECAIFFAERQAALDWLRKALANERSFPNVKTSAHLVFALFVVRNSMKSCYDEVIKAIEENRQHRIFPAQIYQANLALAIIARDRSWMELAKGHAKTALDAAARTHSGFSRHPFVGLAEPDKVLHKQLIRLVKPSGARARAAAVWSSMTARVRKAVRGSGGGQS